MVNKSIKGLLAGMLLATTLPTWAISSVYPCDTPIVMAKTLDGKKELKICLSGNFVSYTYGRLNTPRPEIDLLVDTAYTRFEKFKYIETFEINEGNYFYRYSYVPKFDQSYENIIGTDKNSIRVFRGEKLIQEINMQEPTQRNISWELQNFGVRNIIK